MSPTTLLLVKPPATAAPALDELTGSLELALLGSTPSPDAIPFADARVRSAFDAGSTFVPVEAGDGLWAVLRHSEDDAHHVLCVHNVSDEPRAFDPDDYLAGSGEPLFFLRGATNTSAARDGSTVCHLAPRSYVWLARLAGSRSDDPNGATR